MSEQQFLPLSSAAKRFPGHRGNTAMNPSTLFRWIVQGVKAPNGMLVRLKGVRVGGRWLVSLAALDEFVYELTAASSPPADSAPALRSPAARSRAAARANAKLDELLGPAKSPT